MKKSTKKFEVLLSEIKYGHVVVEAQSRDEATRIALQNYQQGRVTMGDDSDIQTKTVKEIPPIGFLSKN